MWIYGHMCLSFPPMSSSLFSTWPQLFPTVCGHVPAPHLQNEKHESSLSFILVSPFPRPHSFAFCRHPPACFPRFLALRCPFMHPFIHPSSIHPPPLLLLFSSWLRSSIIPPPLHPFIPPSLVLIDSTSTHVPSVSSELPQIIYCLMTSSSSHQPRALLYLLIFNYFVLCVRTRVGEAHFKRYKAQGQSAHSGLLMK